MTDPVFGLTAAAAKLLQQMADKHRQRLPDVGRRTRRVPLQGGTTTTDSGASSSSGGCCTGTVVPRAGYISVGGGYYAFNAYSISATGFGIQPLEYDGGLDWSSDTFTRECDTGTATRTLHWELEVVDTSVASPPDGTVGITATLVDADGDIWGIWMNTVTMWRPNVATKLYIVGDWNMPTNDPCGTYNAPCEICLYPKMEFCDQFEDVLGFGNFPGVDGKLIGASLAKCTVSTPMINPMRGCSTLSNVCEYASGIEDDYQVTATLGFAGGTNWTLDYHVDFGAGEVYFGESAPFPASSITSGILVVGDVPSSSPNWTALAF